MTDAVIPTTMPPREAADHGRAAILALWAYLAATVLAIGATVFEQIVLAGIAAGDAQAAAKAATSDSVVALTALFQVITFVVSGVVTLMWIYRAAKVAKGFGPGSDIKPGWAVGWYFVPFANVWKPFEVMRLIWRISSKYAGAARTSETPGLLTAWWALWILSNILGNAAGRLSFGAEHVQALQLAGQVTLASDLVTIPLIIVLVTMIRRLTAIQAAARDRTVVE